MIDATKTQLDGYFERIEEHLPSRLSQFFRWLRQPSSRIARILVSALLIVGGTFSFLPVLGTWMLPLGLIIISQDLPFLQAPLLRALQWIELTWERLRGWWTRRRHAKSSSQDLLSPVVTGLKPERLAARRVTSLNRG